EFLSEADYTVSLTHNGEGVIHCWTEIKGQPVPIQVIPCCADLDRFSQAAIDKAKLAELRQQFSIKEDDFILSYLGSIGTWYMPDEMLDFFKCLLQHRPDARFLFITPDDKKHILDLAISKGLSADKFIITAAPHKLVPTYLSLSTASLFFIKPVFSKRASSPTKQGEIMGLGIPQVCNANVGDINEIVDEKTGVLVHNFATTDYEAAVKSLLNSPYNPAYIRERAKFFYSLTGGVENYASVYRQIT
ncbi:MAG TPA: glycosyltransferase, partial [Chitinophagales bacterium]|nr:glycosyltransferase [Chitinophagales bacterium]